MINKIRISLILFTSGQRTATEYLIEHGADVPRKLKEWEQVVIACALRGKFEHTL